MAQISKVTLLLARSVDLIPWWLRDKIRKLPGVALLQRMLVRRTLNGAEFIHEISGGPAKGLRFPIKMPDDKLYWTGTYEIETTTRLAAELPDNAVCYDIGCHHGFLAGVMAVNGAKTVYCFEPNPENCVKIEHVRELNSDLDMRLIQAAVGASDGSARFEVMAASSMGKLASSSFQKYVAGNSHFEVSVRSLDSLISVGEIAPAQFIKMDIEGAEYDALLGAESLVDNNSPIFLIEVHSYDLLENCSEWLKKRGYSCAIIETDLAQPNAHSFKVCHLLARR